MVSLQRWVWVATNLLMVDIPVLEYLLLAWGASRREWGKWD